MIVCSQLDGLLLCHDRMIEVVHRSRPLESLLQCVPQIVQPSCTIRMILWGRNNSLLVCHNRTIEVTHRSRPFESYLQCDSQIVEVHGTIGVIVWGGFDGSLG